jgi:hypothetical protein
MNMGGTAYCPTLELQFILLPTPITNDSKQRKPSGGIKARMEVNR